jgi:hypothetical protein
MNLRYGLIFPIAWLAACEKSPPRTSPPPNAPSLAIASATTTPKEPSSNAVATSSATDRAAGTRPGALRVIGKSIAFPQTTGPAFLDYVVYERHGARVWVPVGSTGSVDVLDTKSGTFTRIDGFKTDEREVRGKKRTLGPSAATVGDGFVYVGNRATSEVCPVDVKTLKPAACLKLPGPTDGVVYVASAKEVWVTMPRDDALTVLDASNPGTLKQKTIVKVPGAPEGYAVDDSRGLFFTNLEDKGGTLAIDVRTRAIRSTWDPACGADGPRGLAFDPSDDFVIVACTDHVQVLDAAHDGAPLGKLDTGTGVDNIDYLDEKRLLYVAAAQAARLTVVHIDDKGQLTVVATGETSAGARNAVADANGNAYVGDSLGARMIVFPSP